MSEVERAYASAGRGSMLQASNNNLVGSSPVYNMDLPRGRPISPNIECMQLSPGCRALAGRSESNRRKRSRSHSERASSGSPPKRMSPRGNRNRAKNKNADTKFFHAQTHSVKENAKRSKKTVILTEVKKKKS